VNAGTTRVNGIGWKHLWSHQCRAGTANIAFGGGLLELRDDSTATFNNNVTALTVNSTLVIDHLATTSNTNAGKTITIGSLSLGTTAITLNVVGDHGYGLTTGAVTVTGAFTPVINNLLNAAGYTATGYTPGIITLGNVSGGRLPSSRWVALVTSPSAARSPTAPPRSS